MEDLLSWLPDSPIVAFTLLLLAVLTVPPIFERLRLPGLVGLLVAGTILGPDGFALLDPDAESMKLLSDVGKIYLMFVAGLEIDLAEFRKTKERSLAFGTATFALPLAVGATVGLAFGMGWNASVLLGSLLASHTLLGFPIVDRLGVTANQAVTVTIGATIFTDIAALLVLAICVAIHAGEFSAASLIIQLGSLGIYATIVLFGFDWAGKEYFRRSGDEDSNQFLFVLLAVFLASVGAQLIDVDKIVGAFLAGLAVNDVVGRSPVKEKIEFVGSTLFIPFFFVNMGLLLSVPGFINTLSTDLWLTSAIVGGLFASKFTASLIPKFAYGYTWNETLTMWSLSLPQVAATLAAALVGVDVGILSESVFNAVVVLMLATSVAGPVITTRYARNLAIPNPELDLDSDRQVLYVEADRLEVSFEATENPEDRLPFAVLIPVFNPHTERSLIEMGALLARHESGIIIPLNIARAHVHMDEPQLDIELKHSQRLLKRAAEVSEEFEIPAQPLVRIDDDIARGISRTAREKSASLIVMGWSPRANLLRPLFSSVVENVMWSAHCPVAVMRLLDDPIDVHSILVPIKNLTLPAIRTIRFAQLFAETNQAAVTLLHVRDRQATKEEMDEFRERLQAIVDQLKPQVEIQVKTLRHDDIAQTLVRVAGHYDLVVLRSIRRRTAGGLAVSDVTTRVLSEHPGSLVLFGEPHSG